GKKILMFHGWADPNIPPQYSIAYYDAVTKRMGADVSDFYRYFMVPGMPHCGGNLGLGADFVGLSGVLAPPPPQLADADHDWTIALERWVEQGKAPERIIATEFDLPRNAPPPPPSSSPAPIPVKSTRPICLYPKVAVYKGSGAQSDAANFECALK
ncbi:MAG TPA: tannase/feruloyl esterase family alpha/beta hydrolase, partial [Alphaproteobacteria bacterium]|nr:tannase/feruloyl esterase family alpha/beta hydrolase [Alphaproteobacteria bacterium]